MNGEISTDLNDWYESEDTVTRAATGVEEVLARLRALRDVDDVRYFDSGGALDAAIALLSQPRKPDPERDEMEKGALVAFARDVHRAAVKLTEGQFVGALAGNILPSGPYALNAVDTAAAPVPDGTLRERIEGLLEAHDVALEEYDKAWRAAQNAEEKSKAEGAMKAEYAHIVDAFVALLSQPAAQQDALRAAEREWLAAYRAYEAGHTRTSYLRWVKASDALRAALADTETP